MALPLIDLSNITFSYQRIPILDRINLSVFPGECIGIFGPNGGGKTTLLKLLMGFLTPQRGSLQIFSGSPIQMRHRIGYVPQVHRIDSDFPITVAELIALGNSPKHRCVGRIQERDREQADHWMQQLGLLAHRHKSYGELSGGLAQRALLARALISNPDLLLLDEPTANIDVESLSLFFRTLASFKGKKTILLVTHDLKAVIQHADRLCCVKGDLTFFSPAEICEHFAIGLYHSPLGSLYPIAGVP